ncbi:MAG: hypothetical protein ACQESR_05930 [Planctomycetota bacterium]
MSISDLQFGVIFFPAAGSSPSTGILFKPRYGFDSSGGATRNMFNGLIGGIGECDT